MSAVIYCGDCMPLLADMAANGFVADLVVTDPPYKLTSGGVSKEPGHHRPMRGGWMKNYSNDGKPVHCELEFSEWLPLAYKILRADADIYAMVNDKNLRDMLNAFVGAGFGIHNILVWNKKTATANRWYMKNCEFIVYGWKGKAATINNPSSMQLVTVPQIDETKHSTEKPVPLMEFFIKNSSKPGDLVVDPFAGSGSTGVAARNLGRNFVGIEIDWEYADISRRRLNAPQNGVLL